MALTADQQMNVIGMIHNIDQITTKSQLQNLNFLMANMNIMPKQTC